MAGDAGEGAWPDGRESGTRIRSLLCKSCSQDIADEAQKAETGPVFNSIWFMIVGGLEYLS
jgi:hypothetical protein